MALVTVPSVEKVSETIISETCDAVDHGQSKHRPQPPIAGRSEPNGDGTIYPDKQSPFRIDGMKPTTNIADRGLKLTERFGFEVDVAKLDRTGANGADESVPLPVYPGVTNRAFGIVPDREFRRHRPPSKSQRPFSDSFLAFLFLEE